MKRIILFLTAVLFTVQAFAKDSAKVKKTPQEIAMQKTAKLEKALVLSADQKSKVYTAVLDKQSQIEAIKLKFNDSSNKKGMRAEISAVKTSFDQTMNSLLTSDQKVKYEAYKKEHADKKGKGKSNQSKKRKRPVQD